MLTKNNLHNYQKYAIDFALKNKSVALFLGVGLGKTVTALSIAHELLDNLFCMKVLIIAPLHVCNTVWKQEANEWEHLQDLSMEICTKDAKKRIERLNTKADIHLINRENLGWLIKNHKEIIGNMKWRWDMIIIDESSSFKKLGTQRFAALRKILKYTVSTMILTGTPTPNNYLDLWSQIYLLDRGERLGRTMGLYKSRYFYKKAEGWGYDLKDGAEKQIQNQIKDITISMQAEDYLQLPRKLTINRYIELPPKALQQYKKLKKDFLLLLEDTSIEAPSAAILMTKLLQVSNGFIYDEDKNIHDLHDEKIKALVDIIDDNASENFLIAYLFKADLQRIKIALPDAKTVSKNASEIKEWNDGKIKALIVHPASVGHGLNLQRGGSNIIWFGLSWSLELYEQLNGRIHRQGQTKPVKIIHILSKDCLDMQVAEVIKTKAKSQSELLQGLKAII